jgi:hypothetical protein
MLAPTCFDPSGPSSGNLCWALLKLHFCGISKDTPLYVQQCCGKKCFNLWRVYWVPCSVHSHTALHSIHTTTWNNVYHNTTERITTYFHWLIPQNCNFSKVQHKLPEDGPGGSKHVGAAWDILTVHFNILYV